MIVTNTIINNITIATITSALSLLLLSECESELISVGEFKSVVVVVIVAVGVVVIGVLPVVRLVIAAVVVAVTTTRTCTNA